MYGFGYGGAVMDEHNSMGFDNLVKIAAPKYSLVRCAQSRLSNVFLAAKLSPVWLHPLPVSESVMPHVQVVLGLLVGLD